MLLAIVIVLCCMFAALIFAAFDWTGIPSSKVPVSVNYHFTRKCNATCSFCFHTSKTSYVCSEEKIRHGLALLKREGMRKINFAGGEPFLYRKLLGSLLKYCKEDLGIESISIVSNGSKIDKSFLMEHKAHIDILAVSCDSFDRDTNIRIGRMDHGKDYDNVATLSRISRWCREYGIKFKLNSVICTLNVDEDMAQNVALLEPFRWKVFQVLMVAKENDGPEAIRNARSLQISDEQFENFCARHSHLKSFVPESNRLMKSSYLILDEYMRFLDKDNGRESRSIIEVGVKKALSEVHWDEAAFKERGGIYDWGRPLTTKKSQLPLEYGKLEW